MTAVITFCRLRPAHAINEVAAATRRREGTTCLEADELLPADREGALAGGLLPVGNGNAATPPAAWVVSPGVAAGLAEQGVPGWRITVLDEGSRREVLDGLARSEAWFLRTRRSRVGAARDLVQLPGIRAVVSAYVDTVEEAVAAVTAGAGDLLLRDWDVERLGDLRDALAPAPLVERTAFPPGVPLEEMRRHLDEELLAVYLDLVDGSGVARPRTLWAPGRDAPLPVPPARISAEWSDAAWAAGGGAGFEGATPEVAAILERSLDGAPPTRDQVERLLGARGAEVEAIAWTADQLRRRAVGDTVTYVVNRNINYTNVCYFRCGFCAFSKGPRSVNLRGEPYLMDISEIVARAREAWQRGATEVCLQGGIHPEFTGDFYVGVVEAIKSELPQMHIHGFTPLEVWQGAETLGVSVRDFLTRLRDAGLGSLPGTAAEILDDQVRRHLCPDKIRTAQWAEVMLIAHDLGLPSTATIMFGHIDGPCSWANHLEVVREIQRRSGGITEFVPLPFVHMGAPIYLRGRSRPGPTWDEVVLIHAVARIAFDGLIPNVQASWVKLGLEGGLRLLDAGCNDLGGTLMNEIITRSAGATHGQEVTAVDFERVIRDTGRVPARRTTLYEILERAR